MTKNISIIGTPSKIKGKRDIAKGLPISEIETRLLLTIKLKAARLKPKK